jgi:hypothetical protein
MASPLQLGSKPKTCCARCQLSVHLPRGVLEDSSVRQCFDLDAFGFGHADQGPVCRGECVELSRRGKENAVCERDRRGVR